MDRQYYKFNFVEKDGTESDEVMHIVGKRMPRKGGHGYGDLYLTLKVDFPGRLTEKLKIAIKNILGGEEQP